MACRYTYQGKTYEAAEFDDVLRTMRPDTAAQYMPTVKSIPAAPFVTATDKWLTLALKRIIVMAAQEGYDRVAFINGEQSAERYDLSKQVDMVWISRTEKSGIWEVSAYQSGSREPDIIKQVQTIEDVADIVGKDVAEKVKDLKPGEDRKLQGIDLKVGGEGMKAFYDAILPNTLKGVLKKLGGGEAHAWGASVLPDNLQFTITPAMREKASQGLPLFRATQGTKPGGLSKAAVQLVVDDITKNWKDGPNVRVVESASEMPFNAPADTNGAYYKGTVWIVSKAHHNKAKIARTLAHEAIAHYGLRNMLGGDGFRRYMGNIQLGLKAKNKQLLAIQADVRKAYVDENGKFNLTPNQEADEIAARAVELAVDENGNFKPGLGFLKSVYARIMEFLRDLGFTFHVTHAELQGMLVLAQRNIEVGSRTSGGGDMVVAASRGKNDPVTNQQDVVGNQGGRSADDISPGAAKRKYRIDDFVPAPSDRITANQIKKINARGLRHAKTGDFESYYTPVFMVAYNLGQKGIDLSDARTVEGIRYGKSPEMGVSHNHADDISESGLSLAQVANSKEVASSMWFKDRKAYEYRGLEVATGSDGEAVILPFHVEKLDDEIPNEPTAPDSDGADIRFSRSLGDTLRDATNNVRGVKLAAGYQLSDLMDAAPGKLNWWHKSVGTQYNLAKRFPAFGRVFDTVQEFLHDVSYFATEAGNLAPNIIPKLETVRDIWKSPMKAADAKAIRAPIFEGTLVWGRDENGRAVKMAVLEAKAATMDAQDKAQSLLQHRLLDPMVLRMWQGLPLEQFEAIINAKYDREVLKPGVVWTDTELRNQFNLDKNQIALYREFRKATDKSLSDLSVTDMIRFAGKSVEPVADIAREAGTVDEAAEVLRNYLHSLADAEKESNPKRYKELMDTANKVQMKAAQAEDLKARGYAPLSRFGSHFVDVLDQDGERVYFGLFESATEAKRMARDMQAQFPKAKRIGQGTVSQEAYKLFAGVTPETLELFGDMLGVEHGNNPAFQAYLKAAKSTRSAMRRLIERKGIAGFSEDAGRVLAGFIYSNARQASSNLHMGRMSEAAADKDAFRGDGQLQDQAVKLVDYVKNPVEEAQAVRGLLFAQYIGGSVASALVNITQPVTMTFPWLSQFGGARLAAAEMSKAMKDASKRMWDNKSTGDKALDAALHRAEEDGTVSPQEVHQLVNQASGGGALRPGDGTRLGDAAATLHNTLSRVSLGWGKMFGAAEQFNRQATFIAAYRIAQKQGMKDPDAFARQATVEANGIYNKGNKPAWARGAVGSTLFTFKQFSIAYVEMLDRMARSGPDGKKAALRALAVLFLVAGAGGMPGADDLDDIISGAMQKLGYNFDSKSKRQEFFASLVGEGGAKFLERGVSGLPGVPIDVAGRFGLGNLVPGTGLFQTKKDHTRDVAEIAGPAGDLAKRTFEAAGKLVKGDMLGHDGAMATMAPKAIQNLAQAHDMATMGMYRDQNGKKVLDTDGFDAMAKAIGFQPNDVSRVQKAAFDAQRMIELNKARETEIADKWAKGIFEKDPDAVREAKRDMHDWNADNPDSKIRIKFDQILQRVRKMNQTKAQRIAATAPREIRAQVRRELEQ